MRPPTGILSEKKQMVFQLFVAGDEPHSKRAKKNLKSLCESRIKGAYEINVVDVLESFTIALEKKIFLTPALIRESPEPAITIFGDLSNTDELVQLLGLGGET